MDERVIICGSAPSSPAGDPVHIRLTEPGRTFRVVFETISRAMAADIPARLLDLLEVAAYVFAADQSISRGGAVRRDWGEAWRRNFRFRIPVRDIEFWRRPEVVAKLLETLCFLSEDRYRFEFVEIEAPGPRQSHLDFGDMASEGFKADEIVLFSGGLDSLAGAVEILSTSDRKVALVSHRSSQHMLSHQTYLADELCKRFPGRVFAARILAARSNVGDAPETTQRSRSFLYASLGFVIARMFGSTRIRLCENGVISINLPISDQIVGAMATRTTHPRTIRLFREFYTLVAETSVDIANPFLWKTKGDVFEILKQHGAADLAAKSVSCSNTRDMSRMHPHCGRCSQCIDRRFGALAAGMGEHDPPEMYQVDLFRGVRERDRDLTMAVDYCRHAVSLAGMDDLQLATAFSGDLARVVEGFPGEDAEPVGRKSLRLFRRHGQSVLELLSRAVSDAGPEIAQGRLHPRSLLGAYVSGPVAPTTPSEAFTPPSAEPAMVPGQDRPPSTFLPFQVGLDRNARIASIIHVTDLTGRPYDLIEVLATAHRADLHDSRTREECRFVSGDEIADRIGADDVGAVRQIVSRIRRDVSEALTAMGEGAHKDALIETSSAGEGYRLNPDIRLLTGGD